jgi:hypothetical protein
MHYVLRLTNIRILFEIRKNCYRSRRNLLLYLYTKKLIKLTVVITEKYTVINYIQNFIQYHSFLSVNSICKLSYWVSSVWIPI